MIDRSVNNRNELSRKWPTLLVLSAATILSMSLWFSATAVNPQLKEHWSLTAMQTAWLTMSVQVGFVVGALLSAALNLADRIRPRALFAIGSLLGAAANASIALFEIDFLSAVICRGITGMSCAWVYPVGMKIMATWTKADRGLGLGLLVGAVVVGSASPHCLNALNANENWRMLILIVSGMAIAGGLIALFLIRLGPYQTATPPFRWKQMSKSVSVRSLRLANIGYLGHMWELYAMWSWIPLFLSQSFATWERNHAGSDATGFGWNASLVGFVAIAAGGVGSLLAGIVADRAGRCNVAIASLATSGSCAVVIGFLFGAHPALVSLVAVIWGFAVVADSAQFSSCVSELAEPEYVGTQLTTQTASGFLLTLTTIQMIPTLEASIGWRWAFLALAIGPVVGGIAMWQLKRSPDVVKIAGGRG